MGKDGNGSFFNVTFAVIDNKTNTKLTWFLSKLRDVLYENDDYTRHIILIFDRSKGLINTIAKIFPSFPHEYCLGHLEVNFMKLNIILGKVVCFPQVYGVTK